MLKIWQVIPLPHFQNSRPKLEMVHYENMAVLESCIDLQADGNPVGTIFVRKSSHVILGRE